MVAILREALATGAGVVSVTVDGRTTQYDRKQALQELNFFEKRAAREYGRPRLVPFHPTRISTLR